MLFAGRDRWPTANTVSQPRTQTLPGINGMQLRWVVLSTQSSRDPS
jgi:hypothetical protein